jgi:pimeloyl-ACP methyl ester carboxylesterase
MSLVRQRTLEVGGVRSPVCEAGPEASDEAVVFLHGNPGSSQDYADLVEHLGASVRVVAPDMPGYGKAERPLARDFSYTVEAYADHLQGLLEQLKVRRAHLVLHDMGGLWGLCWAAAHGDQVRSLILFNMGVLPGYTYHKYGRLWRTPLLGELSYAITTRWMFKRYLNADNPRQLPEAFLDRMFDDTDRGMQRAVLAHYRATPDPAGISVRYADVLAPRRLPALVIWGADDAYVPVRYAQRQSEWFEAEVHELPGIGHYPMIEEPELCRKLVSEFVSRQFAA